MVKQEKNRLLEIIKASGLDEHSFRSREDNTDNHQCFIIQLRNSPLEFIVRNPNRTHYEYDCRYVEFSPKFEESIYFPETDYITNFDYICEIFEKWLKKQVTDYLDDLTEPDYWQQINDPDEFMSGNMAEDTQFFPEHEKVQLKMAIAELKLLIIENFSPSDEQLKALDGRLHYLSDALDRLNRFDWRALILSSMMSIATALSLDTAQGKLLLGLFRKVFAGVMHFIQ